MVVNDPKEPANNGKVFLFKFGQKIFEKINDLLNPAEDSTDQPINPFSFWDGANFKLRAGKVLGYVNYDKSMFDNPSALCEGKDAEIKKIWEKEYPLSEFTNEKNFKSYDELKARFLKVVGNVSGSAKSETIEDELEVAESKPKKVKAPKKLEKESEPESEKDSDELPWATGEGDDLSYFENLAKA